MSKKDSWVNNISTMDIAFVKLIRGVKDRIFIMFTTEHEKTNVTQQEIFDVIRLSGGNGDPNIIQGILSGKIDISLRLLAYLADYLGYDVEINFVKRISKGENKKNASTSGS